MTLELGILLALACAFLSNLSLFFKHRGACAAPQVDVRHPLRSARALFRSRWFAIGWAVAVVAWGLHVAALTLAPISIVQIVLAAGVVMVAVMADRLFGIDVGSRQWWGLALTAIGLVLLAITLPGSHGVHSSYRLPAMVGFEAGFFGLGALLIMGPRAGAPAEHHGVMLGAAAGVLFGVSDVAIKALTGLIGMHGAIAILNPWLAVTLLASIAAFYASARGLQDGDAVPVIAVTGTAANISCIAGGILVFGDPMPGDAFGIVVQAFAIVLVIAASALTPAPAGRGRAVAATA